MLYLSNLAAGLDKALDDPSFLLDAVAPFEGKVGLELFLHYHSEEYRNRLAAVKTWSKDLPLALHGPFLCGVDATSLENSREQAFLLDAYRWSFEQAQALGVKDIVFHTHDRVILPQEKESAQKQCKDNLHRLIEMGHSYGVTILVENLDIRKQGVSLFDETDFIRLINEIPEVECLIDVGHLNVAGWSTENVLRTLSSRIKAYHLHNNDGNRDSHNPISEGTFDFDTFFTLYKQYTPDAALTLEYADGPAVTPSLLVHDLEWTAYSMT